MKKLFILLGAAFALFASSCYKDKGNYSYTTLEEPVVTNLDTVYSVFIGDTLKVSPVITFSQKAKLGYQWRISVPELLGSNDYTGPVLKTVFGLGPNRYNVRFTILDSTTGIKYFHDFIVAGKTAFSKGTTVLSMVGTASKLTFVKPDGSLIPNVYEAVNNASLPDGPLQLVAMLNLNYGGLTTGYWITTSQGNDGGALIDPNTFKLVHTLRDNFFNPPAAAKAGYISSATGGVIEGVINGKLYQGASQTYYLSAVYGYFGLSAEGDYEAYRKCPVNPAYPFYFGYDINRKQFIGFTNFGSASYIGTTYQTVNTTAFDPRNVGLDLLDIEQINPVDGYAFGKGSDNIIYELKYSMGFPGTIQITPNYKRPFIQQSLITPTTKWQATSAQIFFFTSGEKIYRYNPLTQDLQTLTTTIPGKNFTMIKLTDGGNTLIAGVDGTVYYLDVSVGKLGNILKKIDGIPGSPVDVASI